MSYIILNAICIAILLIILIKIKIEFKGAQGHASLFGGIIKIMYVLFICPAIITILNILVMIFRGEYKYILFAFIPFIIPISLAIIQKVQILKYKHTYKKYNDEVCKTTEIFLQSMGVDIENSRYHTSYGYRTDAKEAVGKEQCRVEVVICHKNITDIQIYKLVEETEEYLMSCFPKVYFIVEMRVDKD